MEHCIPVQFRVLEFEMQQLLPNCKCGTASPSWRSQLDNGLLIMIASIPIFAPSLSLSIFQDASPAMTDSIVIYTGIVYRFENTKTVRYTCENCRYIPWKYFTRTPDPKKFQSGDFRFQKRPILQRNKRPSEWLIEMTNLFHNSPLSVSCLLQLKFNTLHTIDQFLLSCIPCSGS